MNKFVAKFYSEIISTLHGLFLIGLVAFLFLGSRGYDGNVVRTVLIALGALVVWIVVFGFITTVVVMGRHIAEMRDQLARSETYLKSIAFSANKLAQMQSGQDVSEPASGAREPFVGSNTR